MATAATAMKLSTAIPAIPNHRGGLARSGFGRSGLLGDVKTGIGLLALDLSSSLCRRGRQRPGDDPRQRDAWRRGRMAHCRVNDPSIVRSRPRVIDPRLCPRK